MLCKGFILGASLKNASTTRHLHASPPIVTVIQHSHWECSGILPTMLEHIHQEGGSVLDEIWGYNLITMAVAPQNNEGLRLLFGHVQKHELQDG